MGYSPDPAIAFRLLHPNGSAAHASQRPSQGVMAWQVTGVWQAIVRTLPFVTYIVTLSGRVLSTRADHFGLHSTTLYLSQSRSAADVAYGAPLCVYKGERHLYLRIYIMIVRIYERYLQNHFFHEGILERQQCLFGVNLIIIVLCTVGRGGATGEERTAHQAAMVDSPRLRFRRPCMPR